MAITFQGLKKLGFNERDFLLEDAGAGTYIAQWNSDQPQPPVARIEAADAEWQAEYDSKAYARNRQAEYPSIDELVVALWEGVVEERMASVTALEGLRQAVKTKYPK